MKSSNSQQKKSPSSGSKRAIVIRSAHNDRSATGSRITEQQRIAMRDTARAALQKL